MEKKISALQKEIEKETTEEIKRDYYLTLIKWWASQSLEELACIESKSHETELVVYSKL